MRWTKAEYAAYTEAPEVKLERSFQREVIQAAKDLGWNVHWTRKSKGSPKGWLDLFLARPPRMIFAECKQERGKTTPGQDKWIKVLRQYPEAEVYVWRPSQMDEVGRILT